MVFIKILDISVRELVSYIALSATLLRLKIIYFYLFVYNFIAYVVTL